MNIKKAINLILVAVLAFSLFGLRGHYGVRHSTEDPPKDDKDRVITSEITVSYFEDHGFSWKTISLKNFF